MALGVGLCNNGFMHHGNPALPSAQPPQGVGVCPETELLAGTLVPAARFSEGKQAQRQQVVGRLAAQQGSGRGCRVCGPMDCCGFGPAREFPSSSIPSSALMQRPLMWGPRCLVKSMGFPSLYFWVGDGLPGSVVRLGEVGLVHGPPGRGGEGSAGTEDGRAVSVRGRKLGGALPLRHVPPPPAGRSVWEGRRVDGVRWSWGGRNGSTDTALR